MNDYKILGLELFLKSLEDLRKNKILYDNGWIKLEDLYNYYGEYDLDNLSNRLSKLLIFKYKGFSYKLKINTYITYKKIHYDIKIYCNDKEILKSNKKINNYNRKKWIIKLLEQMEREEEGF